DTATESVTPDPTSQPPTDRTAQCNAAAGIDPNAPAPSGAPTTGLANAIQHVLANCIKNPQAPGLVTALQHLYANEQRQAAHDAAKAAREAEHQAAHPGPGTHGNSGVHGNSGTHGHGTEHGNSGAHGHSGD